MGYMSLRGLALGFDLILLDSENRWICKVCVCVLRQEEGRKEGKMG